MRHKVGVFRLYVHTRRPGQHVHHVGRRASFCHLIVAEYLRPGLFNEHTPDLGRLAGVGEDGLAVSIAGEVFIQYDISKHSIHTHLYEVHSFLVYSLVFEQSQDPLRMFC